MSEKKDYKYKLALAKDVLVQSNNNELNDVGKYMNPMRSGRKNLYVRKNGRRGIFKPTLNVRPKKLDVAEGKKTCCEYGEKLANEICKAIGILSCDVDILKLNMVNMRSKSRIPKQVPGVISYIDLAPEEDLVQASTIISGYKYDHPEEYKKIIDPLGRKSPGSKDITILDNNIQFNNIELIIPAFVAKVKEDCHASDEVAEEIKQRIIEMCVFDCRFANRDRNDENYGLAISKDSVRFYPLFDNEYILGMSEQTADIQKYNAASLQEHINKDLYSVIGITSNPTKLSSASLIAYLFSAHPIETQKAYEKVMRFTAEDLKNLMDEFEGLPEEHKAYALKIFRLRGKELEGVQQEFIDEKGNLIEQKHLPGNKPMELVNRTNRSRSQSKSKKSADTNDSDDKELSLEEM